MKLTQLHGVHIYLNRGYLIRDSGMIGERCAQDDQYIGFIHKITGDGCPTSPQHPTTERMRIGDLSLGFKSC